MPDASPFHFTIITPSFNQLELLKRCMASVADQATDGGRQASGITIHHHVQDGGSTDGTVDWLRQYDRKVRGQRPEDSNPNAGSLMPVAQCPAPNAYSFSYASERDGGMYDALNRGIQGILDTQRIADNEVRVANTQRPTPNAQRQSTDSIVAWLNCDEQYLPGALRTVAEFLSTHPEVDVVCGGALVVDSIGALAGFWKAMPLRRAYLLTGYLYNLSCAMFFRASVFQGGLRFDPSFRAVGDHEFMLRLQEQGAHTATLRAYLSAYTFLNENLSEQDFAKEEQSLLRKRSPLPLRLSAPFWRLARKAERVLRGCRRQPFPIEYAVFTNRCDQRMVFTADRVPARWPGTRRGNG